MTKQVGERPSPFDENVYAVLVEEVRVTKKVILIQAPDNQSARELALETTESSTVLLGEAITNVVSRDAVRVEKLVSVPTNSHGTGL